MSAEILRQAAALMRERAKVARAGRWSVDGLGVQAEWKYGPHEVATCHGSLPQGNRANAEHIASWHPAVALAVADWLDAQAERVEIGFSGKVYEQACAVARAYLGEPA